MHTNQLPPERQHVVHGIDILRFVSAVFVMLFHLTFWISRPGTTPFAASGGGFAFPYLAQFTSVGRMGVEIFFVISGFVIAFSASRATAASFLRGRILRLAPGAWVCASATLVIICASGSADMLEVVADWIRSITFSPYGGYIDGVYWTLGIEVSFYLVILALIYGGGMHHIDKVFLGLAAISTAFCVTVFIVEPSLQGLASNRTLQLALIVHGAEFAVGVFLWRILYLGANPIRCAGLAIGLIGGGLETAKFVTEGDDRALALGIWLLAVGGIVLAVKYNDRIHRGLGTRGRQLARNLGLATYPLYLIHQLIGATMMGLLHRWGVPQVACLVLTIATMIAAASVVSLRIEPLIRARLSSGRSGTAPRRIGTNAISNAA